MHGPLNINKIVVLMDYAKFQREVNKIYTFNHAKKKWILIEHALWCCMEVIVREFVFQTGAHSSLS